MENLLEAQIHEETKILSSIVLCLSRSKYARREARREEKQSEENRGQQLQSSCVLLEHFPKSSFYILYTIWKLRKSKIQLFKPCTIWSWNEEVTAFGRWLLQAEGRIQQSVAKSPFCCGMISHPFCTVLWNSSWSCPIYAASWKLSTSRWKPTSQPCENNLLLRSDFAALFVRLRNLADLVFTCEMVLSASRYLRPTLWDIFLQIFVSKFPFSPCIQPLM